MTPEEYFRVYDKSEFESLVNKFIFSLRNGTTISEIELRLDISELRKDSLVLGAWTYSKQVTFN